MTRIDFYILNSQEEEARLSLACKLCDKAFAQNMQVMVWTDNETQAQRLSALLWEQRPESFLPHCLLSNPLPNTPIAISTGQDDLSHHGLMINLSRGIPDRFSRFQRLAELVVQQEDVLAATRQHYGFFKERGYPLHTHKLS